MADIGSSGLISTPPPVERVGQQPYGNQNRGKDSKEKDKKENAPIQDTVSIGEQTSVAEKREGTDKKEDEKGGHVDIVI